MDSLRVTTGRKAFVTLITSQSYIPGSLTLAYALKSVNTCADLVVLVTKNITEPALKSLATLFDHVVNVSEIRSRDSNNLLLLGRPDLFNTFTKIHAWNLVQYETVVFLDADTLPLMNIDELFGYEELSAAPDCGWPDIFNSGVFVLKPSKQTFEKIVEFAATQGSWDGGDQGLLNSFFHNWAVSPQKRLPFVYNVTPTATYTYLPAYVHFGDKIKVIHFAGSPKPWNASSNGSLVNSRGQEFANLVGRWWSMYQNVMMSLRSVPGASGAFLDGINGPTTFANEHNTGHNNLGSAPRFTPFCGAPIRYSWPEHEFDPKLARSLKVLDSAYHGRPIRGTNLANGLSPEFSANFLPRQQAARTSNGVPSLANSQTRSQSSKQVGELSVVPTISTCSTHSATVPSRASHPTISPITQVSCFTAPVAAVPGSLPISIAATAAQGVSVRDRVKNVENRSTLPNTKSSATSQRGGQLPPVAAVPRAPGKAKGKLSGEETTSTVSSLEQHNRIIETNCEKSEKIRSATASHPRPLIAKNSNLQTSSSKSALKTSETTNSPSLEAGENSKKYLLPLLLAVCAVAILLALPNPMAEIMRLS